MALNIKILFTFPHLITEIDFKIAQNKLFKLYYTHSSKTPDAHLHIRCDYNLIISFWCSMLRLFLAICNISTYNAKAIRANIDSTEYTWITCNRLSSICILMQVVVNPIQL